MPRYYLNLKNEGHDIEDYTNTKTGEEALQFFSDKYDMEIKVENIVLDEDQPAEYGDDGQGNYN